MEAGCDKGLRLQLQLRLGRRFDSSGSKGMEVAEWVAERLRQ